MRRVSVLRGLLAVVAIAVLALAPTRSTQAANVAFRGGPEDHFWDVAATFCKDGFKIEANEILHPDNGAGDEKPYALVITTTSILMDTPLPLMIGSWQGGVTHPLASATVYFGYDTLQPPTSPVSITLERWDHGDSSVIDTGEESPGDDRDNIQPGDPTLLIAIEQRDDSRHVEGCRHRVLCEQFQDARHADAIAILSPRHATD